VNLETLGEGEISEIPVVSDVLRMVSFCHGLCDAVERDNFM
jgi:hypothetical protein